MIPKTHPLIEAATEPLADNAEQRLAANHLLEETLDADHPGADEALGRLEATDSKKHPPIWKAALWALAAIALALAVFSHRFEIRLADSLYGSSIFDPPEPPPLPSDLTERERLLLGDPALDYVEQKRQLHLFDPDNPAYYAEYAGAFAAENEGLPPDYFETVARIAPDNAFFLYYAAGQVGKRSIDKTRSGSAPSKPRVIDGVTLPPAFRARESFVIDRESFDEAMELIAKAAELPDFQTYRSIMMAERSGILPDDSMAEFMHSLFHVYSPTGSTISLQIIADLSNARAHELAKEGRKEEFVALVRQKNAFMSGLARNEDITLVGELVHQVIGSAIAVNFHAAAERLGLRELSETYRIQRDAFQAMKDGRNIRQDMDTKLFSEGHAGIIARNNLPNARAHVASPPPISEADLKPMRLAEHDVAIRLGITSSALILLIACLPVYLFRFLSPRTTRLPAKRLALLLRPSDWAWVFLCGILLPLVVFLGINRLTPLGGRDYALTHFLYPLTGVHLIAILLNLLLAPALVIRWRLSERLAPFGIRPRIGWLSCLVLLLILLWSLVAYRLLEGRRLDIFERAALFFAPLLWAGNVFLDVMRTILGKPRQRIARTTTSIALLPAYAMGVIALCLTLPIFIASEKHWITRDKLYRFDPEAPDLGAYEFKVAAEKRKEINAITGVE